jgi:Protein of unknown function (DUF4232)
MGRRFAYGGASAGTVAILLSVAVWSPAGATGSQPNAQRSPASAARAAGAQQLVRILGKADGRAIKPVGYRARANVPLTATHACRTSELNIRIGHSQAAGGTAGAYIEFINRSMRVCKLQGWPRLIAGSASRGFAVVRDTPASGLAGVIRPRIGVPTVILVHNHRADAVFAAADGQGIKPCGRPYRTLRVIPPGNTQSVTLSAWIWYLGRFLPSCGQIRLSPVLPSTDLYKG